MGADLSNERNKKGRLPDTTAHSMGGAQFAMMMAAHRQLFERIEAINRTWLAIVQESNKSGSDLAFRLIQCTDPAEAQALCDAWLRDCATRFVSFSRDALGSWLELQRLALGSVPKDTASGPAKSGSLPKGIGLDVGHPDSNANGARKAPEKSSGRRAESLAELARL